MARPTTGRTERVFIRLTPDEKTAIEAKAGLLGLTGADWLRRMGLEKKLPSGKLDAEARRLLLTQVVGMARNMNQLTAHAHRSRFDEAEFKAMHGMIRDLVEKVGRL